MYKADKKRAAVLWSCGVAAVGACLALIIFFVYTLVLRTSYRAFCLEINDAILHTDIAACTVGRGDEVLPADKAILDYYDEFLLDEGTLVFARKGSEPTERSIILTLGENTLVFTPVDNGTAVCLRWTAPDGTDTYTVRTGYISFAQLSACYTNYRNRLG